MRLGYALVFHGELSFAMVSSIVIQIKTKINSHKSYRQENRAGLQRQARAGDLQHC